MSEITSRFVRPELVPLREAWPREDIDFTPWLAENLAYLGEVGLGELELLKTEVPVPGVSRRLDILAEAPDGERIAIENQYREIDHDHLTRGLAYAVGLEARTLVVIAESHRDEFVAVADYLNRAAESLGDEGIAVVLLTVRVERVGEYFIPRFDVVSRPNEWRTAVKQSATGQEIDASKAKRELGRRQFWDEFLAEVRRQDLPIFQGWNYHQQPAIFAAAIPSSGVEWHVRVREHQAFVELKIDSGDGELNLVLFERLREHEAEFESVLGALEWDPKESVRLCSITMTPVENCGWRTPTEERAPEIARLVERVRLFYEALRGPLVEAWSSVQNERELSAT